MIFILMLLGDVLDSLNLMFPKTMDKIFPLDGVTKEHYERLKEAELIYLEQQKQRQESLITPFKSIRSYRMAMQDARYSSNNDYRELIQRRAAKTDWRAVPERR